MGLSIGMHTIVSLPTERQDPHQYSNNQQKSLASIFQAVIILKGESGKSVFLFFSVDVFKKEVIE